ncbi:MAG: solute:sodium symporter family transporter [Planctomycetales bacterium]|nr:solute:sodium symporter family transporter [Planctomycetales bacterium]
MLAITSFLFFTALVAYISWWYTRHDALDTSTGYYLAGRSLTWVVVGGSLLLTNLSTEQLVGLNGGAFKDGMETMAWELGAAVAMVVMAIVCLPIYLRCGITTIPEFLERRYNKPTRGLVSLIILIAVSISVLPFVLYSGALFMRDVFELPRILHVSNELALWITVAAIGIVGGIYAIFGGLRAVAISDTLNGVGLLVAGLLIPILGLRALGEGDIWAGVTRLQQDDPSRLNPIGDASSSLPVGTLFTGVALLHLYYWCTNQFIVQRAFASQSLQQGQKGVMFAAVMKLLGPFYLILPGVIAYHLFRDQIDPEGNSAYGTLVRQLLPKPLLGFFAAAIFGAILSSFNSALNSCATLFSVDLYKGFMRPQATDHEMVRVGKLFGTVLAIGVIIGACMITSGEALFQQMKSIAATFDIPVMVIVFVGILSKRTRPGAVWAALLVGVLFYATITFGFENKLTWNTATGPQVYEIHWLHVAGLNFLLMMSVIGAFRVIAPLPTPFVLEDTNQVDTTPWPLARPLGAFVLCSVAAIYALLWMAAR